VSSRHRGRKVLLANVLLECKLDEMWIVEVQIEALTACEGM
jgi:hypothetical protein